MLSSGCLRYDDGPCHRYRQRPCRLDERTFTCLPSRLAGDCRNPWPAGSSPLAQGGIAGALGTDDSAALHIADTLAAGEGLCDRTVTAHIIEAAPQAIATLEEYGVCFDRKPDGTYSLGLEAAHARHRIAHVDGDATGAGIMRALIARVLATPSITVRENTKALRLITHEKRVCGVELEGVGPVAGCAIVRHGWNGRLV